ncbi:citrate synthase [Sphingomonas sp. QA11]|uniref:citrate synthase n=1 Tax=Sphingomonas sp. QA11 TaxID=2950605 RepID=UPI00234B5CBF|nr:citrate synthase [Sphingomonas sp. QA11]WCM25865.1 citrate synthase [Sphingomonas sp. QA11]
MSDLYLTADEAASELGISVKSLYAYVSRKRIRTTNGGGSRSKYYWAEDIARVKRGERLIVPDSILVPTSDITSLGDKGPIYRGRSAIEMAESETLESTAAHLWTVPEKEAFLSPPPAATGSMKALLKAASGLSIIERAACMLPLLEHASSTSHDISIRGYGQSGASILRWFAALMLGEQSASDEAIHLQLSKSSDRPIEFADILRRLLVLAADHELSPSTYAVRAAANTGVTPHQAIAVGLIASQGRRLPGGRTYLISRLVNEIIVAEAPKDVILRYYRDNEDLPGFGDGVYPHEDPRATAIAETLAVRMNDDIAVRRMLAAAMAAKDLFGKGPDFLVLMILIEQLVGLTGNKGSLMLLARISGWIAHASEQSRSGPVIRIRAAYTGRSDRAQQQTEAG